MCIRTVLGLTSLLLLITVATVLGQEGGAVQGTVLDEGGRPLLTAKVYANPMNGRPAGNAVRYAETDKDGRFLIDRLEWGEYGIFASKEEAGYPDLGASLYSDDVFPKVRIAPSSPLADIQIRLGPKAATLTGSITNIATGAPLQVGFKLTRAESPTKWLLTSEPSNYKILIPSSTDVLLEVTAPGFKTWSSNHPLHLQPSQELRLDISLEPSHDPSLHPSRFLIPQDYVGWLLLQYNIEGAEPTPVENGTKIFEFPLSGALNTSSTGPDRGAENEYFYISKDGVLHQIPMDYRLGNGMIWGQYEGTRNGALSQFGFFIGTEEQYHKFQMRKTRPGPIAP